MHSLSWKFNLIGKKRSLLKIVTLYAIVRVHLRHHLFSTAVGQQLMRQALMEENEILLKIRSAFIASYCIYFGIN